MRQTALVRHRAAQGGLVDDSLPIALLLNDVVRASAEGSNGAAGTTCMHHLLARNATGSTCLARMKRDCARYQERLGRELPDPKSKICFQQTTVFAGQQWKGRKDA